jgi:hypothetical protein
MAKIFWQSLDIGLCITLSTVQSKRFARISRSASCRIGSAGRFSGSGADVGGFFGGGGPLTVEKTPDVKSTTTIKAPPKINHHTEPPGLGDRGGVTMKSGTGTVRACVASGAKPELVAEVFSGLIAWFSLAEEPSA